MISASRPREFLPIARAIGVRSRTVWQPRAVPHPNRTTRSTLALPRISRPRLPVVRDTIPRYPRLPASRSATVSGCALLMANWWTRMNPPSMWQPSVNGRRLPRRTHPHSWGALLSRPMRPKQGSLRRKSRFSLPRRYPVSSSSSHRLKRANVSVPALAILPIAPTVPSLQPTLKRCRCSFAGGSLGGWPVSGTRSQEPDSRSPESSWPILANDMSGASSYGLHPAGTAGARAGRYCVSRPGP